jgi:hypothetical protein
VRERERDSAQPRLFVIDATPTCTFCVHFTDFSPKKGMTKCQEEYEYVALLYENMESHRTLQQPAAAAV